MNVSVVGRKKYLTILLSLVGAFCIRLLIPFTSSAFSSTSDQDFSYNTNAPLPTGRGTANATLVFLARNSDLSGVISSMQHLEEKFNKEYGYPWVFLNEEPFSDDFKTAVQKESSAPISFGLIPSEDWYQPDWIDEERATEGRDKMKAANIIYADNVPYRNMCRFNSGFFYKHPLLQPYRYYWRVEPDIKYFCDVTYDPFDYLRDNKKTYGFTISFYEWEKTIPTLWATVKEFMALHPEHIASENAMNYLSDNGGDTYNLCHFWSNFEIADMDFWRSEAYTSFFDFLDSKGGFYYERWGDAPVHSIAAALFLPKSQLHFFRDIGYRHEPFQHCPKGDDWVRGMCTCNSYDTLDYAPQSCISRYEKMFQ
ncbi:glycosyltransferase family 15 protein [Lentinula aff. detonsa]|uniref:Glycosyltransferase family 15 protein n=1 Tax=Lentinula aff. detonsa TaxID=2804958 RepID=A0AA38KLA9_9AGAR|nr:glycosyltransferase family 15 protein [Lentinula aff. detonsa]